MDDDVTILLSGVVGSTAYGMATPESDVDRLGMYAEPTVRFHGLHLPVDKKATRTTTKPDMAMHEVRKFCRLALQGNPTVSELLWLDDYEVKTALGQELIDIRGAFLSQTRAQYAYLNYARQQFQRLANKGKFPDVPRDRVAKHARHLYRLVEQFCDLWVTGELTIKVKSPKRIRDFGERVADGEISLARGMLFRGEATVEHTRSALPEQADEVPVEAWLRKVRREMWTEQ